MPQAWRVFRFECFPHSTKVPTQYFELEGAIVPNIKGTERPDWKLAKKSIRQTVIILTAEQEAWEVAWEKTTGNCRECAGTGEKVFRVSAVGAEFKPCWRCAGKGKIYP